MPEEDERDIMVELTMPYVKFEYTAKSEQRKRASGIQYMLLKMIGYSEQVSSKLKIKDVMTIFSISVDLTPFILSELALLARTDMVTLAGTTVDKLSPNTPMSMIKINEKSRSLYETGYVRTKMEDLRDDLLYMPMRNELFRKVTDMQSTDLRVKVEVDLAELENHLRRLYPDSEITEVMVSREKKDRDGNILSQGPKIRGYAQKIYLYFNLSEGCFEVDADRSGLNIEKVKASYKGDALLKKIDAEVFTLNDEDGLEVNSWALESPEGVVRCILPRDFRVMKGLFFYGNRIKNNNPPDARFQKMGDDLGCDALLVTDSEHVCKYWFARGDVTVKGFDGVKKNQNMVYFQPIVSAETVKQCLQEATSNLKLPGDLDALNSISSAAHNPSLFVDAVCDRIENGSRAVFTDTLTRINRLPQKVWKPLLESGLEDIICRRMLADGGLKDATDFCSICMKNEYNIIGTRLIGILKTKFPIADVADWSLVNDIGKKIVLTDDDLPKEIMELIKNGTSGTYESELMKNVSSAAYAFSGLKTATGITDPKGYSFNMSQIDRETSEIPNLVSSLYTALDSIAVLLPSVTKDSRYRVFSDLKPVFTALSDYLKSKKTKWSRSDIRNEENPLLFCTVLKRKMSQALSRIGAEDVASLKEKDLVGPEILNVLNEFAKESDRICTSSYDENIDPETRSKWTDAVLKLEELS